MKDTSEDTTPDLVREAPSTLVQFVAMVSTLEHLSIYFPALRIRQYGHQFQHRKIALRIQSALTPGCHDRSRGP